MWILLTILVIIVGLTIYIKIVSFIDSKKYCKKYQYIFDAHKQIGFPQLTNEQQFDILNKENTLAISRLTQNDFIPTGLLNYYINIDPEKYLEHLKTLNLKEVLRFDPNNLRDGFFIRLTDKGYEYLFVERQHVDIMKKVSTYDRLLKYLTFYKLNLYAPKKYKLAWLKKYFA